MLKIVSGGQTGADRAALDAALELGIACGGWCPAGRRAEDGPIPRRYPLTEHASPAYSRRTRQNVIDSDATLIVCYGPPTGGTALTQRCCQRRGKPCVVIDASTRGPGEAARQAIEFVRFHHVNVLNVAGPRASAQPAIYRYVHELCRAMLRDLGGLT